MRTEYNAPIALVSCHSLLISDSLIFNNSNSDEVLFYGGGLRLFGSSGAMIRRCVFSRNSAPRGAAIITGDEYGSAEIDNCVFDENIATSNGGGAVYAVANSTLYVSDSRFMGNSAAQGGGAISAENFTSIYIFNNVFWNNAAINGKPTLLLPLF
jgi:predicted outer membrane repeat protein